MDYSIDCTGDVVVGDEVEFERSLFSGSFKNPKFLGTEKITGKVIRDSYGADKQQHTFTLLLKSDEKLRIKGRNLYRHGTWRKPWVNEEKRIEAQKEKHVRGGIARAQRRKDVFG